MIPVLSVRQAHELSRLASRHGPLAVKSTDGGLLVALSTTAPPVANRALELDHDGRVIAHQRLGRAA